MWLSLNLSENNSENKPLDTETSIFTNVEFSNVDNKMSKTVVEFHWYLGRLQNIDFNGRIGKFGRFLNS